MQETSVPSLGLEDTLAEDMATCSSILAGKIAWIEEPGRLLIMGSQMSQTLLSLSLSQTHTHTQTRAHTHTHTHTPFIQCSNSLQVESRVSLAPITDAKGL